jgi:hypothetical protein
MTHADRAPARPSVSRLRSGALAFAPLHKRAFGIAVGVASGAAIFLLTAARLVLDPEGQTSLILLAQFFYGYTETWPGALLGAGAGFLVGFVAGWFVAFSRNLTIATWIFLTRARADLAGSRAWLDHL